MWVVKPPREDADNRNQTVERSSGRGNRSLDIDMLVHLSIVNGVTSVSPAIGDEISPEASQASAPDGATLLQAYERLMLLLARACWREVVDGIFHLVRTLPQQVLADFTGQTCRTIGNTADRADQVTGQSAYG